MILAHLFANNQIRIQKISSPPKQRRGEDGTEKRALEKKAQLQHEYEILLDEYKCGYKSGEEYWDGVAGIEARLDILKKSQASAAKHDNWGKVQRDKKFSAASRRKLLEAANELEARNSLAATRLITLTIPGHSIEIFNCISRYSGWIINNLLQAIRDYQRRKIGGSEKIDWFFVWEFQKRGALHLHFCIAYWDIEKINRLAKKLVNEWYRLLFLLEEKENINLFYNEKRKIDWRYQPEKWQSNIQVCKKSVGAYFAKYASKEVSKSIYSANKIAQDKKISVMPSRFWGSSQSLKKAVQRFRIEIRIEGLNHDQEATWYERIIKKISEICDISPSDFIYRDFRIKGNRGIIFLSGIITTVFVNHQRRGEIREEIARFSERIKESKKL